jgi:hypothetical protein
MFCGPDTLLTVPRASGPVFKFCAPALIFGGTEGVGSYFHVLRVRLIFGVSEGIESRFHIFCAQTRFLRYRRCRVPFSSFAFPNSFSAVPRSSGPVFMFCAPGLVFHGTEGVGSRFQVLRSHTHFRRYREHRVSFSCFARQYSFSAVPRASTLVFMFCAPGLIFGGTEGVRSRFQVLCSRTHFRRYRGHRLSFSYFARPDSFSVVPRASGPILMCRAPGLIFGGTDGVGIRFHVSRA